MDDEIGTGVDVMAVKHTYNLSLSACLNYMFFLEVLVHGRGG